MKISQISPWISNSEANYTKKILLKKFLTESKETENFEKNLKNKFNNKYLTTYCNWTAGLYACLKILNLNKGDEVLVPNLTFISTVNSIIFANLKPVLCEIDKNNLCIDLKDVQKKITKKTKVVIPVHLYGNSCDMTKLKSICKKNNLYMIEDSAQAIGATYKNKFLGTIGDMGGVSLYGNKIITSGEGGIIFCKKKKYSKNLYKFKNHGREKKGVFIHKKIGFNFMFTEMQAAIGNVQLKKLDKILIKKNKIANFYKKKLDKLKEITFIKPNKYVKQVHWFTNILVNKKYKNKLQNFLKKRGIQTRSCFYPVNLQPCYKKTNYIKNINEKFLISKNIYDELISLPSSFNLSIKQQMYVISTIKQFFQR